MNLYSWDCSRPGERRGGGGGGVTDDENRAMRAAEKWMRDHQAQTARVEEVRLAWGGWGVPAYEPTGKGCTARLRGDEIAWAWFELELAVS